jgi:hypothetical protein
MDEYYPGNYTTSSWEQWQLPISLALTVIVLSILFWRVENCQHDRLIKAYKEGIVIRKPLQSKIGLDGNLKTRYAYYSKDGSPIYSFILLYE